MSRRAYPTDLTDAQWSILEPLVPTAKTGGRPPTHARRELINAMLYVLRAGCAWRMLPHEFPPWQTVYHYFRLRRLDETWECIHTAVREQIRQQQRRHAQPSGAILDSQSAKTTEEGGAAAMTAPRS